MTSFSQYGSPFADLELSSCQSKAPNTCCLRDQEDEEAQFEVSPDHQTVRIEYDSGAFALINQDFQIIRSNCYMMWFRDRFAVMHIID